MWSLNVNKGFLKFLKYTCHLKTLSYDLQMANIFKFYKISMSTGDMII